MTACDMSRFSSSPMMEEWSLLQVLFGIGDDDKPDFRPAKEIK
jgi:hypothetical protein